MKTRSSINRINAARVESIKNPTNLNPRLAKVKVNIKFIF